MFIKGGLRRKGEKVKKSLTNRGKLNRPFPNDFCQIYKKKYIVIIQTVIW